MVLAGHKRGLDDLDTRLAFLTLERLMVRELRAANASARDIAESEDENKREWAQRVDTALAEASMDFNLTPAERRRKQLKNFLGKASG